MHEAIPPSYPTHSAASAVITTDMSLTCLWNERTSRSQVMSVVDCRGPMDGQGSPLTLACRCDMSKRERLGLLRCRMKKLQEPKSNGSHCSVQMPEMKPNLIAIWLMVDGGQLARWAADIKGRARTLRKGLTVFTQGRHPIGPVQNQGRRNRTTLRLMNYLSICSSPPPFPFPPRHPLVTTPSADNGVGHGGLQCLGGDSIA